MAVMDLVRRVECNLRSVMILSAISLKSNGSVYFKLPVGLLLRCCCTDCLMGMHMLLLSEDKVVDMLDDLHKEYTKSLFERYPVYKDKVSTPFDDSLLQGIYTGMLEDHFLAYLDFNENFSVESNLPIYNMWKAREFNKHTIGKIKDTLLRNSANESIVSRLYSYYKYFSQYEHFSESGHGDTLAPFGEDNVSFEKALDAIEEAVKKMVSVVDR